MGLLGRLLGTKPRASASAGVGPWLWQPPRIVQPTYELREKDRQLWEAFEQAAATSITFEALASYAPRAGGPTAKRLKNLDDDVWWSRSTGELLVLVERIWAGFPDPLPYSLLACDVSQAALVDLGQFWTLPDCWTRA